MKSTHIFIFLLGIGLTALSGGKSAADLASSLYQSAKALYNNNNCNEAKDALTKYKISDREWLMVHPDIQAKIDAMIAYCTPTPSTPGSSVAVGPQITVVPNPRPPAP